VVITDSVVALVVSLSNSTDGKVVGKNEVVSSHCVLVPTVEVSASVEFQSGTSVEVSAAK
jgi:hypothetical protein